MPVLTVTDPDRPKHDNQVHVYDNASAMGRTVTDERMDAARDARREAAGDVGYWAALKAECGRFAKDEQRRAQRMEKAATLWIRHFEDVGQKSIRKMPVDMADELDLVFGRMNLA